MYYSLTCDSPAKDLDWLALISFDYSTQRGVKSIFQPPQHLFGRFEDGT
jgi:hypothetical protein